MNAPIEQQENPSIVIPCKDCILLPKCVSVSDRYNSRILSYKHMKSSSKNQHTAYFFFIHLIGNCSLILDYAYKYSRDQRTRDLTKHNKQIESIEKFYYDRLYKKTRGYN